MKRRRLLQSVAALQALPVPAAAQYSQPAQTPSQESTKITETPADAVADSVRSFFSPAELSALEKLAAIIVPRAGDRPGAVDAGVPAFLDNLLRVSPADRQQRYKAGLSHLNSESQRLYKKPFAELSAADAAPILKPLSAAWTYAPPQDSFSHFLCEAKEDLLQATVNSREFAVSASRGRRSAAGVGAYWLPLE